MNDFITLSCPSCGGKLEITNDIERFACGNCGTEHIVRRGGGIISIFPIAENMDKIRTGVDKTAAELALVRLQKEIEEIRQQNTILRQKILKKYEGNHMGVNFYLSTLIDDLLNMKVPNTIHGVQQVEEVERIYKECVSTLTVEDIDYIIEKGMVKLIKPKHLKDIVWVDIMHNLQILRNLLMENNNKIQSIEIEIKKLKKLVAS